mmetsp:Transcript_64801/g.186232  ORF Transcript_64801/g.186232 Transcript_64801/m.186232 type:complete len:252 (-) Transcript_64801:51-806(-)
MTYREGVADGRDIAGGHSLRRPDGAGIVRAGQHVEDPQLFRVSDHERFRAVGEVGGGGLAAVRAVKAKLDGEVAHGLNRAAGRRAALERDLGEVLNAGLVVAERLVRGGWPADSLGGAGTLTNGQANLVLHAIVHIPIGVCLGHLGHLSDRERHLLALQGRVLGCQVPVDDARVAVHPVVELPNAALGPLLGRNADQPDVRGVRTTVVGVADHRRSRGAGILAHGHNGAAQGAGGQQRGREREGAERALHR